MSDAALRDAALAAFHAGDHAQVREWIAPLGINAADDPLLLQLHSLAQDHQVDQRAMMRLAALDGPVRDGGALFNQGVQEQDLGRIDKAILLYQQALRLEPNHLGALNNLSDLLRRQKRGEEAWARICAYLSAGGDPSGLEVRIAKIADDTDRVEEARHWFGRAIAAAPGDPATAWEHAMQQLRDEEFAAGWEGYEARRAIYVHDALAIVSYATPEWAGEDLASRSLLVHKEQGFGDTIMFASCLPDLAARCGALHLAVQPPLSRLFAINFPEAQVWPSQSRADAADESHQHWRPLAGPMDFAVPFGSLPRHVRSAGFPAPVAYLKAAAEDVAVWNDRLAGLAPDTVGQLRAGLVIAARRDGMSGPGVAEGMPKTLPAALAHPLAVEGVAWFGLHDRGLAFELAHLPGIAIVDTSDWLFDFADTAALISQLDVVVAVDTAVAHLAGAMGKKVLLMLRRNADWRWGRDRADSYWYPDIEVFRQVHEGDWSPVTAAVGQRLAALRDEHACNGARR
jgi:tetratricopeptide (TPR) repeat protein